MVPLGAARRAARMTLQDVCDHINADATFPKPVERGTVSAIERGHRGASDAMLAAIASALGLAIADVDTDYEPRRSRHGDVA